MPLVSVIIPTYNRTRWIRQSIASAIGQQNADIEVIVVDDGSSSHIVQQIAAEFPNTRYIYQPNQGPGATRNTGIAASTGEFVQFLDDDDWLSDNAVQQKLAAFTNSPNLAAVYTDLFWTDENGKILKNVFHGWKRPLPSGDLYPLLVQRNFIPIHALLWKRAALEAVNGFPLRSAYEDWETLLKVSATARFGCVDQPLGYYRRHPGNISRSFSGMMAGKLAFQAQTAASPRFQALPADLRKKILIKYALLQSAFGNPEIASQFLHSAAEIPGSNLPLNIAAYAHHTGPFLLRIILRTWHEWNRYT